ncbi:hypothetical protein RHOFW104T7_04320 [Rhodanobacter thiooxydans]|uniref:Uncharacterized protein n=1 Tax=Rhodanobacter thiooxydans TaxID=416169 RepID=A0A154QM05_9GAMM|nr:hypothetical protein [Rhodanobacter thiooxydans]EIM00533.1 hypothetical protein UUA_06878 [Rhodanobacter thiooxydans LCS2]KZC25303.1 hypothetical protein RHOFW104T7_04320 [Rhodanobacter thiooxydans]MCW0200905.1 hypothetical protein [Rhodanobacter thiooxydans]
MASRAALLLPETPLPSGWSIDPVTGCCVRISDGIRVGPGTSRAIAWSANDIEVRSQGTAVAGQDVALMRLRNAAGCAATSAPLTGNLAVDAQAIAAIHAMGAGLVEAVAGTWYWQPEHAVSAAFNKRLGGFLDAIGVEQMHHPATRADADETWLLTGRIGTLAVRSELVLQVDTDAHVILVAQACGDAVAAVRRARDWAVQMARQYLTDAAETTLSMLHSIPFHEDDAACVRLGGGIHRLLADHVEPNTPPVPTLS